MTWTNAGTVTTGTDGVGQFNIQIDPAAQAHFYRVLSQ
jgi:hypothetical protein